MLVGCRGGPETKDPVLFTCQNADPSMLITMAYSISSYQLSAPDWIRSSRFDLRARVPENATKDDLKRMLQTLLADRFKLAIHHETREIATYNLVLARNGPRLKPAAAQPSTLARDSSPSSIPPGPPPRDTAGYPILTPGRPGMAMMNGKARLYEPAITLSDLARRLSGQLQKPVHDATGLDGKYEVNLSWAADLIRTGPMRPPSTAGPGGIASAPDPDPGPTLFRALQDQLGLRLEPKKSSVDFIVIDHLEKSPTEN